ncbi:MAG: amidohydrolase family protein [Acidobacteria bacterium]|nr:amidohydrolase family protein [Acidobacteriota bacterium]
MIRLRKLRRLFLPALILISAVLLRAPAGYCQQSTESGMIVLQGATLIDGMGGPPMLDSVVVIQGDSIKSVASGREAVIPPQASIVDLTGKFMIPGLIDSHVHWVKWMGELYVNHGVTSVLAQLDIPEQERVASETSPNGPRMFHTGGRSEMPAEMTQEQVRQAVADWLKKKPDVAWLPDFRQSNRDIYRRVAEEAHRAGFLVFSHAQNAPEAIEAGLDVVEHVWGFAQALMNSGELQAFQQGQFPTWATFMKDWGRLDQMVQDAVRHGVYLNPTLVYEWGGLSPTAARREQEAYRLLSNPDLAYFPQNLAATLLLHHRQIKNFAARYEHMPMLARLAPEDLEQFRQGYRNVQELLRRFVRAGGKVISGTDTGSVAIPGLGIHHEMELLVEAGLTPMQALQASTSWPAEILAGRGGALGERKIGSIRAGNYADLVVLGANPLDDITNTKEIERVLKGGKFVPLGYHPEYFTLSTPLGSILMSTPAPEISSISPHSVVEGGPEFEMVIEGAGFVGPSIVRVGGISMPTQFEGPRKLRVRIPAALIASARPDRFGSPGPEQNPGIFGDRTVAVTVYNPTPEGGTSNSVSLIVRAKWREAAERY